jgi:predicted transcriptional regulator
MAENDIDDILEVLENPTRRMILRELAREPRYSLQLAQMLNVSQQAIMKHLRVMEDREMVRVIIEKSDAGGPPRKCYLASKRFSITIDMGPGLFEEVVRTFGESGGEVEREGDIREPEEARAMLADTLDGLERVDAAMENLDARRTLLLDEKERLMKTAYELADRACDDDDMKRVLRHIIEGGETDVESIAEALNMREKAARSALKRLMSLGLFREDDSDE